MKILTLLSCFVFLVGCGNENQKTFNNPEPEVEVVLNASTISGATDFGVVNTGSKILTIKVTNSGTDNITGPATISGSDFSLVYQSGCALILPKKFCTVKVSFDSKNKVPQVYESDLMIGSEIIPLTASIVAPEIPKETKPQFLVGSTVLSTLDFGVISDKQSVLKTISIKNVGDLASTGTVIVSSNFVKTYDTCSGKSLLKNQSCSLKITLNGAGKSGAITGDIQYSTISLDLTAEVVAPSTTSSSSSGLVSNIVFLKDNIVLDPLALNLNAKVGAEAEQNIIYIKNTGTLATTAQSATMDNTNFNIVYNQCLNKVLSPNGSCQLRFVFSGSGKTAGVYSSILSFGDKQLTITANVLDQAMVSYTSVFMDPVNPKTNACSGTVTLNKVFSHCVRSPDSLTVSSSFCPEKTTTETVTYKSPANTRPATIDNATSATETCAEGSEVYVVDTNSIVCPSPFQKEGNACYTYTPIFSSPANTKTLACSGTETVPLAYSFCQRDQDLAVANNSFCPNQTTTDTITFSSPEDTRVANVNNATSATETCGAGLTEYVVNEASVVCQEPFLKEGSSCNSYTSIFIDPPNTKTMACSGSETVSKIYSHCQRDQDLGTADNSYCPNQTTTETVTFNSPADTRSATVENASTATETCGEGLTSYVLNPESIICQSNYVKNGLVCQLQPTATVSSGGTFTCANKLDGTTKCFGFGTSGQLGNGGLTTQASPVTVSGSNSFKKIVSGRQHSCGLTTTGGVVKCWGMGANGRIGNGGTTNQSVPQTVSGSSVFVDLFADSSAQMTCGMTNTNVVQCWGTGSNGQLGNGGTTDSLVPSSITSHSFVSIGSGNGTTCGVLANGTGYCWGAKFYGRMGDGGPINDFTAGTGAKFLITGGHSWKNISPGGMSVCGLTVNNDAYCWGSTSTLGSTSATDVSVPKLVSGGLKFRSVKVGYYVACGITLNNDAYCWGTGANGEFGNGGTANSINAPVLVSSGGHKWNNISPGDNHVCGVTTAGVLYCWGNNQWGQLGLGNSGTGTNRLVPTQVTGF